MHFLGRWMLPLSLVLFGCLLAAGAGAAGPGEKKADPPRPVDDTQGQLFSPKAEEKANAIIADIKAKHHKDYYVETFTTIPEDFKGKISEWALHRFKQLNVDGVYVLICKEDRIL